MPPSTISDPPPRELLDEGRLSHGEVRRALLDLARTNRWLLGYLPVRRTMLPRLRSAAAGGEADDNAGASAPWVLDVGTGLGDVAADLAHRAHRCGRPVRIIGLDSQLRHLTVGRRLHPHQPRVVADAGALPFADDSVEWSLSSLVFHHFDGTSNRRILGEMVRVARRGAAVIDLRYSPFLRRTIGPLLRLLGIGFVARHDGIVSAATSWRLDDVRRLAEGHRVLELRRRFPFRFSLILDSSAPNADHRPANT